MPAKEATLSSAEQLTVIIPTLNEAANIQPLLTRIFEQSSANLKIEVLFVDDGSIDATCERISSFTESQSVRLLERQNPSNGLAGAVLEGTIAAKTRWILVMDADLSHPPERIGDLMGPLIDGSQDMVIGSRYVPGGRTPGWPWWRRLMSRMACLLARPLTNVKDPLSGFFATQRMSLLRCKGDAAGFKIGLEVIVNANSGFRVKEIPIVFQDRLRGESKMQFRVLVIYFKRLSVLVGRHIQDKLRSGRFFLGRLFSGAATSGRPGQTRSISVRMANGAGCRSANKTTVQIPPSLEKQTEEKAELQNV